MSNLRLVILDYPKKTLADETTKQLFADMLQIKQINFQRTSDSYICMGPLDMISTHTMIYDTTDIYKPKLVLAMRACYEDRAKQHKLSLPIEEYNSYLPLQGQKNYAKFRNQKKNLVDCNAWFVDPDYSFSKTGLKLSDVGFFATALYILRTGNDHLCGCSNERYKASRWVKTIGDLVEPVEFIHPKVPDPHDLILINHFSKSWLQRCFKDYGSFVENAFEQVPTTEKLLSLSEIRAKIESEESRQLLAA